MAALSAMTLARKIVAGVGRVASAWVADSSDRLGAPAQAAIAPPPRHGTLTQPELVTISRTFFGSCVPAQIDGAIAELDRGYPMRFCDLKTHMLNTDEHMRGVYFTRRVAVAGTPYEIKAGIDASAQIETDATRADAAAQADFCRFAMSKMDMLEDTLLDILDAIGVGYSVQEIEWYDATYKGSHVWLPRLHFVHPRRFRFVEHYRLILWDQGRCELELAPSCWLVHTPSSVAEYPTNAGDLRAAVWLWLVKTWGWKFWTIASEKFGSPLAVGKILRESPPNVRAAMLEALENLASDHAAVIEVGEDIDIKEPSAGITADIFSRQIAMINAEVSKGLLGASDLAEPSEDGSRAATEVRDNVRVLRAKMDASALSGLFRKQLFPHLLRFNAHLFSGPIVVPEMRFKIGEEQRPISQSTIDSGSCTRNELRAADGLRPWGADRGGDEALAPRAGGVAPSTQPAQPAQPAQPVQPVNHPDPSLDEAQAA